MGKFNKKIIIVIALLIVVISSYFIGAFSVNSKYDFVDVPVASEDIINREMIKNKSIKTIKVPYYCIADGVLVEENSIIGKYVKPNLIIQKGSFFYANALDDINNMNDSGYFDLNENETIYDLFISNVNVNVANLYMNMYVDLYLTIDKPIVASDILIGSIKICGLYGNSGEKIIDKNNKTPISTISLVVSNEMIPILNKAIIVGDINIVPCSNPYKEKEMYINREGEIMQYLN